MERNADGVRAARLALRMRSQELAAVAGLRPSQMSRIECGKAPVPGYIDTLLALFERDESAVRFALDRVIVAKQAKKASEPKRPRGRPRKPKPPDDAKPKKNWNEVIQGMNEKAKETHE